jgi:hypothetical protein
MSERRIIVFWNFILLVALAVGLLQLGALSVWVVVLKFALLLSVLAICGLAIALIWRASSAKSD